MRHGAARIAPFSLMVPVFGLASAALAFGERLRPLDAAGSALIAVGLLAHVLGGRWIHRGGQGRSFGEAGNSMKDSDNNIANIGRDSE